MEKYPYLQNKTKITNFQCEDCRERKPSGFKVEWRVDIFQGNCEFENTCDTCLVKQLQNIQKENTKRENFNRERERKYEERMKPKWERLEKMLAEAGIEVKKYPATGQWVLNNIIDWWTTTGTAINRKTRQQFNFTVERPEQILKLFPLTKSLT